MNMPVSISHMILTISMKRSSLAEAIYSPVWLKLIVLTGHLKKGTDWLVSYKDPHDWSKSVYRGKERGGMKMKTYSSFVNVLTQSISEISHKLTKESALPTAKFLSK